MSFFIRQKVQILSKNFTTNPEFCHVFRRLKIWPFRQCITVTTVNLFYEFLSKQFEAFGFYFSQGNSSSRSSSIRTKPNFSRIFHKFDFVAFSSHPHVDICVQFSPEAVSLCWHASASLLVAIRRLICLCLSIGERDKYRSNCGQLEESDGSLKVSLFCWWLLSMM